MEGEQYKENAARESQERIDAGPNFDKLAVKKEAPPDENASIVERWLHNFM